MYFILSTYCFIGLLTDAVYITKTNCYSEQSVIYILFPGERRCCWKEKYNAHISSPMYSCLPFLLIKKKMKQKLKKTRKAEKHIWAFLKLLISQWSSLVLMYTWQDFRNFCTEVTSRIRLAVSASLFMLGDSSNQEADYRQKYLLFWYTGYVTYWLCWSSTELVLSICWFSFSAFSVSLFTGSCKL